MKTSCQITPPQVNPETNGQVIDLFDPPDFQILVSSKEYHELKHAAGYWKGMHKKARLREDALKQKVKELEAKVRDLTARLFGKKR